MDSNRSGPLLNDPYAQQNYQNQNNIKPDQIKVQMNYNNTNPNNNPYLPNQGYAPNQGL